MKFFSTISRLALAGAVLSTLPVHGQTDVKGVPTTVNPSKEMDQVIEHPSSVQATSFEEVVDRSINGERMLVRALRDKDPVIETYIQEMKPDPELGDVPHNDFYFLGQLNMQDGLVHNSYLPERSTLRSIPHLFKALFATEYNARGFADQLFIDVGDFDRVHYQFKYIRREFLGDVRTIVIDVDPRPEAGRRRFKGRMWVEDRDYSLVRFQGSYQPNNYHEFTHFDSWRTNTGGMWLPSFIYSEEGAYRNMMTRTQAMRAQTRLWGYQRAREKADEAFTNMTVDVEKGGVKDESEAASENSPLQAYRAWEEEAAQNVADRLERAGLLAPTGEVDQVLDTVIGNLRANSNLGIDFPVRARVLLTTPLESVALNHTVLLSRGLIDVLPDEASLAAVLAHELAHIALGHSINTRYAFEDRLLFDDPAVVKKVPLGRTRDEEKAADARAIEILAKSPYKDNLPKIGLFLRMLSARSSDVPHLIKPLLGNQMADTHKDLRMAGLMDQSPELKLRDKDQISALPLGSRIKMDPWSNKLRLIKTMNVEYYNARDKMPFELTPFMLHLTREDTKTAVTPAPPAETAAPAPVAATTSNNAAPANNPRP